MVVAAPDHHTGPGGDYYFAWMRDGALSMNAYMQTASSFSEVEQKMDSWLGWVEKSQNQPDPHDINILTEPKFVIPSGKPFPGGWCRPQNDGPGLRAITLMALVQNKPSIADRAWNVIKEDLDWVADNYTSSGCDLWEEVKSTDFFWNRFTMRKALTQGAKFAQTKGDADRASKYAAMAKAVEKTLAGHVGTDGYVCESTNRCKDTAVIEAFNVGYMDDGVFAPLSKEVVATLAGLSKLFCRTFAVNADAANKGVPGVLFGRYEGDGYAGGNPWVLLTASAATLFYRQAADLSKGVVPKEDVASALEQLIGGKVTTSALLGAGDAILLLMKKYLSNGMHMNEQIDRNTGTLLSAKDLTWNYANVLKAMKARSVAAETMRTEEQLAIHI
jgi:glucoamylase